MPAFEDHGKLYIYAHRGVYSDGTHDMPDSSSCWSRYELTPESRAHINFKQQRQFGSLWKLLSELPDEPGVLPEEFINKTSEEPKKK